MRIVRYWMIGLCCCRLAATAFAQTNSFPATAQRNEFALKPAAVATNAPAMAAPVVRLKLLGIAALPPRKWAVLQVEQPGKPAAAIVFREGQSIASVEVTEIDASSRTVTVRHAAGSTSLTFEADSVKPAVAAATEAERDHQPIVATADDPNP
jgi:hypothetical protein